jgi:hypothetical protein
MGATNPIDALLRAATHSPRAFALPPSPFAIMRLTLRTLLAYMDDILDPADQEELGRKIEASPFATELIHRSRDAVRRLRLSAPEVLAGEEGDLHGGDNILDANTAAEYLDSVLTPDEVVEFERHCLEAGPNADMLLAEAASCHHILTLVLGEPAEVDADLRQRMYALVRHAAPPTLRVEPAHSTPGNAQQPVPVAAAAAISVPAPAVVLPQRPAIDPDEATVPDYMLEAARARRRTRWLVATLFLGAVSGALMGGFATWLFWPGPDATPPKELAKLGGEKAAKEGFEIGGEPTAPAASATTANDEAVVDTEPAPEGGGEAPTFNPGTANPGTATATTPAAPPLGAPLPDATAPPTASSPIAGDPASAGGLLPPLAPVDTPTPDAGAPPVVPTPTEATTTPPGAVTTPPGDAAQPAAPTPPATADAGAAVPVATATTANMPTGAPVDPAAPGATTDPAASAAAPPATDATTPPRNDLLASGGTPAPPTETQPENFGEDAGGVAPRDVEPAEPESPRVLGAYLGLNNDLLLRFDATAVPNPAWLRLPPRSNFIAGDRLLTLPAFRTHVVLNPDVNAYVAGGTEIALLDPADAGGDVNVAFPYGRLILNSGPNGNRIALVMGDLTRVITLGPSSSLAVEVTRQFLPGNDYESTPAPLQVSWYLTSGKAEWSGDGSTDAPGQTAEAPAMWTTAGGTEQLPQTIDELPAWIDKEPTTTLEANARDVIAESVAAGQPVDSALIELTTDSGLGRRGEVRSLAARGATYVGQFEPLVKALADTNLKAKRAEQITALRDAVARDPSNIERIAAAFELQRGADAAEDLTKMVVGFSPEEIGRTRDQVQERSMVRLINWLDDEDLTYRVLANYNINEITGTKDLGGYRPEHSASQRQREIQIYLRRFEAGDLMPRQ